MKIELSPHFNGGQGHVPADAREIPPSAFGAFLPQGGIFRGDLFNSSPLLVSGLAVLTFALGTAFLCFSPGPGSVASDVFTEITDEAGITWKNFNGESEDRFLIEATSGGVGFLDFDSDGLLDI